MRFDAVIVGGGISGLAAAFELQRRRPNWRLALLEREPHSGGKVLTEQSGAYLFDHGPNGFQAAPRTLELVDALGLRDRLVVADARAGRRYLYVDGGLRPVPLRPQELLTSDLLSPAGKLRLALEPLIPPRQAEESVHDFVARRFGGEAARMAGPMVAGVSAGDARATSLDALFPAMRRLEQEHGSVLRGMAKARGSRPPAGLHTFSPGGMGMLTTTLAEALGSVVLNGSRVTALTPLAGQGYRIETFEGGSLEAARVALAVPAFEAARLVRSFAAAAAQRLDRIRYADVDVFALAFDRVDVPHALDGFGYLIAGGQGIRTLGVLWTSSLFPDRAPPGKVLLRAIVGGALDPEITRLDDDEALEAVRTDLRRTLGITAAPEFCRRLSWRRGLPQYELGHREQVAAAMAALRTHPGLVLAGNAYNGVAVNDCVRDGDRVAEELTR